MMLFVEKFGKMILDMLFNVGRFTQFLGLFFYWLMRPPFRIRLWFRQFEFVGNRSLSIVILSSFFTGAVLGLQLGYIFKIFSAESMMGAATGKTMALELSPVMCGFILAGRAGAAMAAEIGTMRVNEQLDAMLSMGVDPMSYLIVPRVIAGVLMTPLLGIVFLFLGNIGTYVVGFIIFDVDQSSFMSNIKQYVISEDITNGLVKCFLFGFIFSVISCYKGYYAHGGAKGVGNATTEAVVSSLLTILIVDFFVSYLQLA